MWRHDFLKVASQNDLFDCRSALPPGCCLLPGLVHTLPRWRASQYRKVAAYAGFEIPGTLFR